MTHAYLVRVRFPLASALIPVVHLEHLDDPANPYYVECPALEDGYWPGLYRADLAVDRPGLYSASVHEFHGGPCLGVYLVVEATAALPHT